MSKATYGVKPEAPPVQLKDLTQQPAEEAAIVPTALGGEIVRKEEVKDSEIEEIPE